MYVLRGWFVRWSPPSLISIPSGIHIRSFSKHRSQLWVSGTVGRAMLSFMNPWSQLWTNRRKKTGSLKQIFNFGYDLHISYQHQTMAGLLFWQVAFVIRYPEQYGVLVSAPSLFQGKHGPDTTATPWCLCWVGHAGPFAMQGEPYLGGGFKYLLFSPLLGEMIRSD